MDDNWIDFSEGISEMEKLKKKEDLERIEELERAEASKIKVKTFGDEKEYSQFIENHQNIEIISVNTISEFTPSGTTHFNGERIMLTYKG